MAIVEEEERKNGGSNDDAVVVEGEAEVGDDGDVVSDDLGRIRAKYKGTFVEADEDGDGGADTD